MPENAKPLVAFKKGELLTAAKLNEIMDRVNRQRIDTGQSSGLVVQETNKGTVLRVFESASSGKSVGLTGSITARSGVTPGSGSVQLYRYDSASGHLVDSSVNQNPVYNFAASAIPSGKFCWIEQDGDGTWWVVSVEC